MVWDDGVAEDSSKNDLIFTVLNLKSKAQQLDPITFQTFLPEHFL